MWYSKIMRAVFVLLVFSVLALVLVGPVDAQITEVQQLQKASDQMGQPFEVPVPGVNCGLANTVDVNKALNGVHSPNICCTTLTQNLLAPAQVLDSILEPNNLVKNGITDFLHLALSNIPVLGFFLDQAGADLKNAAISYRQFKEFEKNNPGVSCITGRPSTDDPKSPACICKSEDTSSANIPLSNLCYTYLSTSKNNELGSCVRCASKGGVWTAIGCVPTNFHAFVSQFLLSFGIGFGGMIALLCIIYSAFMLQTSQGSAERIKKAQENLTSCIMGLMLIIFSVFILRVIGIDILKIPQNP